MFSWLSSLFICFFIPLRTISSLFIQSPLSWRWCPIYNILLLCLSRSPDLCFTHQYLEFNIPHSKSIMFSSKTRQSACCPQLCCIFTVQRLYWHFQKHGPWVQKCSRYPYAMYLIVKRDTLGHKGQLINHLLINNNCSQGSSWDLWWEVCGSETKRNTKIQHGNRK